MILSYLRSEIVLVWEAYVIFFSAEKNWCLSDFSTLSFLFLPGETRFILDQYICDYVLDTQTQRLRYRLLNLFESVSGCKLKRMNLPSTQFGMRVGPPLHRTTFLNRFRMLWEILIKLFLREPNFLIIILKSKWCL